MSTHRQRFVALTLALGVAGVGGGTWWRGPGAGPMAAAETASATGEPGVQVVHFHSGAVIASHEDTPRTPAPVPAGRGGPVAELSEDAAAHFAALCQLKLLAADTELDLSHREWAKLTEAVTQAQAVRLAYEAEIARTEEVAPGRFRVEIPAYAAAGDELRRRFEAELRAGLGDAVAAEVREKLGSKLEGRFAGFGVSAQTLEITGDPRRAPGDVTVQRTASYWNSVEAGERATTRHETILPAAEDPTGATWSPLLALISKAD